MGLLVIGQVVASRGLVQNSDADPYTLPANAYMRDQSADVPLRFDHDPGWRIGTVTHLERSRAQGLMAVARIDDDRLADHLDRFGPFYFSDRVQSRAMGFTEYGEERGQGVLVDVSLVRQTANCGTQPVAWSRSEGAPRAMPWRWHETWKRALDRTTYRRSDRLPIVDLDSLGIVGEVLTDPDAALARSRAMDASAAKAVKTRAQAPVADSTERRVRVDGVLLSVERSVPYLDLLESSGYVV